MEPNICPVCHQPVLPTYYFCPNCGAKLNTAPLSTSPKAQVLLYVFSIVLPMLCFIFAAKWQGVKYFKSQDPKAHQMGQIAWVILILATIFTIWLAYNLTAQLVQSSVNSLNTDLGAF